MIQDLWQQTVDVFWVYVPRLAAAFAILVVGWLAALLLAAIVRGVLRRTTLDNRIADWIASDKEEPIEIERAVGRIVFFLAMLFVLVAFFDALSLTVVTEPLNALLTGISGYVPNLLGAAALLLTGWIVASMIRRLLNVALQRLEVDRRLGGGAGIEGEEGLTLSSSFSEAVYWLILLLFLPAALGALGVEGLLGPVEGLVDEILGIIPNLFAALLIFAVGWFAARLVQRVVTNLLAAAGIDAVADQLGVSSALGAKKLSGVVGLLLYVLILIPVLISSLQALELSAITGPATEMLSSILSAIPLLFGAALLLVLAYFVGRMVAELVSSLLRSAGFDNVLEHIGIGGTRATVAPSAIVGTLLVVAIMLFASIEAAALVGFETLSALVAGFVVFAGQVVIGIVVLGVGMFLARVASEAIRVSGIRQAQILSLAAYSAIVILAGAMALRQMGLADDIINLAFGLLLGSVAIAIALAFGLGSRDIAARQVESWVAMLHSDSAGEEPEG
jgi:hypothetical protein